MPMHVCVCVHIHKHEHTRVYMHLGPETQPRLQRVTKSPRHWRVQAGLVTDAGDMPKAPKGLEHECRRTCPRLAT